MKNKYLKDIEFNPNISRKEARERSFIIGIESVGIQGAILEYILHAGQLELLEIYALLKQELDSQSLFPL
jgi:hypothetical protein